jgi:hypothetical protein
MYKKRIEEAEQVDRQAAKQFGLVCASASIGTKGPNCDNEGTSESHTVDGDASVPATRRRKLEIQIPRSVLNKATINGTGSLPRTMKRVRFDGSRGGRSDVQTCSSKYTGLTSPHAQGEELDGYQAKLDDALRTKKAAESLTLPAAEQVTSRGLDWCQAGLNDASLTKKAEQTESGILQAALSVKEAELKGCQVALREKRGGVGGLSSQTESRHEH